MGPAQPAAVDAPAIRLDLLALIGLAVALIVSSAITALGTGLTGTLLGLLDLGDQAWARLVVEVAAAGLTLVANWLVFVWVLARLPREPVPVRSAMRAAVLGAVGLVVLQQVMTVYLAAVTTSPAGVAFGPVLGLLVFANVVSRLLLVVTAWAATVREDEPDRIPEPAAGDRATRSHSRKPSRHHRGTARGRRPARGPRRGVRPAQPASHG